MGRRGVKTRILSESIWLSVERHIPALTSRLATLYINNLLDAAGERPISRSFYVREHAARRNAQRLALGAAVPAVIPHTPAVSAAPLVHAAASGRGCRLLLCSVSLAGTGQPGPGRG